MNENETLETREPVVSNLKLAIFLGLVALIVGLMPFFYLKDMTVPG